MILINELKQKYSVEMAVVVLACRVHFKTATVAELEQFIDDNQVRWPVVLLIARGHSIRPIVYRVLAAISAPPAIAITMREESYGLVGKSLLQAIETDRIITLLNKGGIKAVPYKGVAFSKQFYGDLVSRESSDIDLIIYPADLNKLMPLLKQEGYVFKDEAEYEYLGERYFSYYKDISCEKLKEGIREFYIEFHWRIAERLMAINPESDKLLFDVGENVVLSKTSLASLNPTAHYLAVLIHHSHKDVFFTLKKTMDISQAALAENFTPDWAYLLETATHLKLKKALIIGNKLANDIFGVNLASGIPAISDKKTARFIDLAFGNDDLNVFEVYSIYFYVVRLRLKDSVAGKLKYLFNLFIAAFIPNKADFDAIRFPRYLFFLYYITKPPRVLFHLFQSAKKDEVMSVPVKTVLI